ncbi:MAG: SO_0444 family Cu/Zn efflux transporter [bacterium]
MTAFWSAFFDILNGSAIYLLVGFVLAGVIHVVLTRHRDFLTPLTGSGFRPVFLATLVGLPMPLCSCSVLPTGLALLRKGASKGATASFLITVPETDIVSILLTYGLIGPVMAIFRPLAALVTGLTAGVAVNLADRRESPSPPDDTPVAGCGCGTGGCDEKPAEPAAEPPFSGCCCGPREEPEPPVRGGVLTWLREIYHFGFVEFFDSLVLRLLIGLLIGAAIWALVPSIDFALFSGSPLLSYLLMLVIGVPMYVCATASTPIAAGLIASGISPGAALVFLLVGPATNSASMLVLIKQFGRLVFGIYLGLIMVCSVLMGLLLDLMVRGTTWNIAELASAHHESLSVWGVVWTVIFLAFTVVSLYRVRAADQIVAWLREKLGLTISRRGLIGGFLLLMLVLYLLSGCFIVSAGERAAVTRFGQVTAAPLEPGLHYHWPAPFGDVDILCTEDIQRVEIGYRSVADPGSAAVASRLATNLAGEAWMLTGDENIIDIKCVTQFQIRNDAEAFLAYLYGVADGPELVRAASEWSVRQVVGQRGIDSLLTIDRAVIEQIIRDDYLQPVLDACHSGVRVVGVKLQSVHAPPPTHWAFRDVASAAENAVQKVNEAREYKERVVLDAQGSALRSLALSEGKAFERAAIATGSATVFDTQRQIYREAPRLMRSRLYLETMDAILPDLTKYIDLTSPDGPGPELWLRLGDGLEQFPMLGLPKPPLEEGPE